MAENNAPRPHLVMFGWTLSALVLYMIICAVMFDWQYTRGRIVKTDFVELNKIPVQIAVVAVGKQNYTAILQANHQQYSLGEKVTAYISEGGECLISYYYHPHAPTIIAFIVFAPIMWLMLMITDYSYELNLAKKQA